MICQSAMPRLLRDPDLVRRLDLTGEPQQLERGLGASDRRAALTGRSTGREDVQTMNSTIAQGGLVPSANFKGPQHRPRRLPITGS